MPHYSCTENKKLAVDLLLISEKASRVAVAICQSCIQLCEFFQILETQIWNLNRDFSFGSLYSRGMIFFAFAAHVTGHKEYIPICNGLIEFTGTWAKIMRFSFLQWNHRFPKMGDIIINQICSATQGQNQIFKKNLY